LGSKTLVLNKVKRQAAGVDGFHCFDLTNSATTRQRQVLRSASGGMHNKWAAHSYIYYMLRSINNIINK
jgi:hypothetical protein